MNADLPGILASISESSLGLPDLRFYPKGIFEDDGVFLGIYFFKKSLGLNLGNCRKFSVKVLSIFLIYCKVIHGVVRIAYSRFF